MYLVVGVGPQVFVQSSSISHEGHTRPPDELELPLLPAAPASPPSFVVMPPSIGSGGEEIFAFGSTPLHAAANPKEENNPKSIRVR
jgi:hypothetical protein